MGKKKSFKIKEARQETQKGDCAKIRAKDPLGIPRKGDLGKNQGCKNKQKQKSAKTPQKGVLGKNKDNQKTKINP